MKGTVKKLIDHIITQRSKGNPTIAMTTKTKFILKGINPDSFTQQSEDDPQIIRKLQDLASELGITLS